MNANSSIFIYHRPCNSVMLSLRNQRQRNDSLYILYNLLQHLFNDVRCERFHFDPTELSPLISATKELPLNFKFASFYFCKSLC